MQIINDVKLDFQDVLIRPKRTKTVSRSKVNLEREYRFLNSTAIWTGIPIIAANMTATGTFRMAEELAKYRMMTCLHKHYSVEDLTNFYMRSEKISTERMLTEPPDPFGELPSIEDAKECWKAYVADHTFYTMGIKAEDIEKLRRVIGLQGSDVFPVKGAKTKIRHLCIDVANGYQDYFVDCARRIRDMIFDENILIMAGNVSTPEMVQELLISGAADIVKIGNGSGSVCTTRTTTGCGYPQLSAIIECADASHGCDGHVCADGGCTMPGDVCKAFGAGTDFVMLGGMLSGTDECDGEWLYWDHKPELKKSLKFYGMSSKEAQLKYDEEFKSYRAAEGKCAYVPYKGSVSETIQQILGGLRSACAYVGTDELKNLSKCTTFIRVNRTHNMVYGY